MARKQKETLSDKKVSDITSKGNAHFYPEKDVKEFIKRIKERINQITFSIEDEKHIIKVIDEEVGEDLK